MILEVFRLYIFWNSKLRIEIFHRCINNTVRWRTGVTIPYFSLRSMSKRNRHFHRLWKIKCKCKHSFWLVTIKIMFANFFYYRVFDFRNANYHRCISFENKNWSLAKLLALKSFFFLAVYECSILSLELFLLLDK